MTGSPFRVAIIKNYSITAQCGQMMLDEISRLVRQSKPDAQVSIYAPIEGTGFPDANYYDLVILTGGLFDLLQHERPAWVAETLEYIRIAYNEEPRAKILGICWGQQACALALGGSMAESPRGPCIGVETLQLTPSGTKFFNVSSLDIHKHHKRIVTDIGPELSPLALNNEILISRNNRILTFQGHPELNEIISQWIVDIDDPSYAVRPELKQILKPLSAPHDGQAICQRIVEWVLEG
ncbi:class I glutamine amidotransferase-like protein [Aspergillus insuetus]